MRPLLHEGKAKPLALGEIIDPKKFSASTEDVYREFCAFKLCSLAGVDVVSILFFSKFLLIREFCTVLVGTHS